MHSVEWRVILCLKKEGQTMSTGLLIERRGDASEVPLSFVVSKSIPFEEPASLNFRAEVWCPQSELHEKCAALRDFINQICKLGFPKSFDISFGPMQPIPGMKVHLGMCNITISVGKTENFVVSADLVSIPPGENLDDLMDTCMLKFYAGLPEIEDFLKQLENSTRDFVRAALVGFDAVTRS